ncbi:hypothetical protein OS493_038800, partial [Desmophyllum pertusum]
SLKLGHWTCDLTCVKDLKTSVSSVNKAIAIDIITEQGYLVFWYKRYSNEGCLTSLVTRICYERTKFPKCKMFDVDERFGLAFGHCSFQVHRNGAGKEKQMNGSRCGQSSCHYSHKKDVFYGIVIHCGCKKGCTLANANAAQELA